MKDRIDTAVILGAGVGRRLGELAENRPKGFLKIDGRSLIERSCSLLAAQGIRKILIGTGYAADHYERFARSWQKAEICCIFNEDYETTGSIRTLYDMRDAIDAPFLLLESDLLYESRALSQLLVAGNESDCTVLASGFTRSEDEVYIEIDDRGFLRNIAKDRAKLGRIDAELVGISRVGLATLQGMCRLMKQQKDAQSLHYEEIFALLAKSEPIEILKIEDLVWCEIDNAAHLQRALEKILPRLDKAPD